MIADTEGTVFGDSPAAPKQIPTANKTGVIYGESNEDYHAHEAISSTNLKAFAESPVRYYCQFVAKTLAKPNSSAMAFGSAGHTLILEGLDAFQAKYDVMPPGGFPQNTTKGKDGLVSFVRAARLKGKVSERDCEVIVDLVRSSSKKTPEEQAQWDRILGSFVVSQSDFDKMRRLRQAVMADDEARAIIEGTQREVVFRTPMLKLGFQTQCRCDIYSPDGNGVYSGSYAADLKTIDDIENIEKNVQNFGYYRSAPFYASVINALQPERPIVAFPFIFVEKEEPHRVRVVELDPETWLRGSDEVRADMKILSRCIKGEITWEQAERKQRTVSLPEWYLKRDDSRWSHLEEDKTLDA